MASDTISLSDSLMSEGYKNWEAGEESIVIEDPMGDVSDEDVQRELDANPALLASIMEHQQNNLEI